MPRSTTPAGSSCLAMRTSQRGELLLPTTFACDLIAVGASFRTASLSRRLAARRCCPRSSKRRGLQRLVSFRGSITRPQRPLSTLRSPPHDGPRKTRLQLVANLCCAGLVTRRVTFKVSALTWLPPRPSLPGAIRIQTWISRAERCLAGFRAPHSQSGDATGVAHTVRGPLAAGAGEA